MTDPAGISEFRNIRDAQPDPHGLIELLAIPLGEVVVYPKVITPLFVAEDVMTVVKLAVGTGQTVIGIARHDSFPENPGLNSLSRIGTEIALGRLLYMPDGRGSVLAQGRRRVEIVEVVQTQPNLVVRARPLTDTNDAEEKTAGMAQAVIDLFRQMVELSDDLPDNIVDYAAEIENPGWLADFIASTLMLSGKERQAVLDLVEINQRLQYVALLLGHALSVLEMKDEITSQVQQEMVRGQREMYLREQMRIIQTELGEEDIFQQELNELSEQIDAAGLPEEVHEKAVKEVSRLAMMPPMAPEVGMIRTYIDWLIDLPWNKQTEDKLDIANAQRVLDDEHYGLPKVKDRILEHIAVRKMAGDKMRTPILCFVGPPGVGKTSLGKSIAKALGREFVRVSLGGVRDESEIRGHRRTYIGALPGRILQTMRRAGTINPVFMLDEIDKLGVDFRGDPAAALLEALDPEQNNAYLDHYLDVPYDLSKVMFITTANDLATLPEALIDRLEVIEFTGYTEEEKLEIARKFLIPKQLEAHGLVDIHPHFEANALKTLIREYTYEAGVRNLEREIANIFRKVARLTAEGKNYPKRITIQRVNTYLGPPGYITSRANEEDAVGVANGLVWSPAGGDIQTIEVSVVPGKGNLTMTGQLGDVLQESAQAAMSYMRSRASGLNVPHDDFEYYDVHVHMPEGSVPKDGPSAGITLAIAIISAFTERKIRSSYAMTGEITLRGRVLPVGGVKEKLLAARRARIKNVIIPKQNKKDLVDVPQNALRDLNIILVEDMQQVIDHVLLEPPPEGRKRDRERQDDDHDNSDTTAKNEKKKKVARQT